MRSYNYFLYRRLMKTIFHILMILMISSKFYDRTTISRDYPIVAAESHESHIILTEKISPTQYSIFFYDLSGAEVQVVRHTSLIIGSSCSSNTLDHYSIAIDPPINLALKFLNESQHSLFYTSIIANNIMLVAL